MGKETVKDVVVTCISNHPHPQLKILIKFGNLNSLNIMLSEWVCGFLNIQCLNKSLITLAQSHLLGATTSS